MSDADIQDRARQIVDDLAANGARFEYQSATETLPAGFTYWLPKGGDRWRARRLIIDAKRDAALWHTVVEEVGRCSGGAGAS